MKPQFVESHITAICSDCKVPTSFEWRNPGSNTEFGSIIINKQHQFEQKTFGRTFYTLYRCSVCSRAGVAKLHVNNSFTTESALEWFWPSTPKAQPLPSNTPLAVAAEFKEAELCMSAGAWRGAAGLLRSALEKVLKANGYDERDLFRKIEAAGADGVITSARRQRAQDLVRTLGNDVLHDEWREVSEQEVDDAHHYVARIIEDFYDERPTVENVLLTKGRRF